MQRREFIHARGGATAAALAVRSSCPAGGNAGDWLCQRAITRRIGVCPGGFPQGSGGNRLRRRPQRAHRASMGGGSIRPSSRVSLNDLVKQQVSVIVALGPPAAVAVKKAATSIPIVFSVGLDPVAAGLVASLNRPDGNMTGVSFFSVSRWRRSASDCCENSSRKPTWWEYWSIRLSGRRNANSRCADGACALECNVVLVLKRIQLTPRSNRRLPALQEQRADAVMINGDPFFDTARERIIALWRHAMRSQRSIIGASSSPTAA